jgi:hypothetical protein
LGFIFTGLGVSETVFLGFFIFGSAWGVGMSTTFSMGAVLTSFLGAAAGLAGGLATATGPGLADGGPGKETRLTLIDPGENRGFGTDAGQNTTEPMKIKWIASDIPKYSSMVRDPASAFIGYA